MKKAIAIIVFGLLVCNTTFAGIVAGMFGSWGIGQVVESTKSILASACFHLIIQIMMFNALIKNGIGTIESLNN